MELKFTKSTDSPHKVTLTSTLVYVVWQSGVAPIGQEVGLEVGTSFVGNGAPIEIKGKSEKGKNLGKIKETIRNNKFIGKLTIPEDTKRGDMVYFEVKLPKNGLSGESNRIPAVPPIKVSNLAWSATEARRGDILTLSADIANLDDGVTAKVIIYEKDADGAHDKIVEIPTVIKNSKIKLDWEYEYHEDTDEIPTEDELSRYGRNYNPPEYFFTVKIAGQEFGKEDQASGLLLFKDWLEVRLLKRGGEPFANEHYVLTLPDGTTKEGDLDENGYVKLEDLPPGPCKVRFPNVRGIEVLA